MHPHAANCNTPNQQCGHALDGSDENTARLTRMLAGILSRAADHTSDRLARHQLLDAAARCFDAFARLEALEAADAAA
jgi:hypothetical protein